MPFDIMVGVNNVSGSILHWILHVGVDIFLQVRISMFEAFLRIAF